MADSLVGAMAVDVLVLPFTAAVAVAGGAWLAGLRGGGWAAGLGVLAGALAGQGRLAGLPALPPVGAVDKLPLVAVGGLLLALVAARLAPRARWAAVAAALVAAVAWLAWPRLAAGHGGAYVVAGLLAAGALWALVRLDAARGAAAPLTLLVAGFAAAGVALYGASSLMAQVIAAFAAALGGAVVGAGAAGPRLGAGGRYAGLALLLGAVAVLALYTRAAPLALVLLAAVFAAPAVPGWLGWPRGEAGALRLGVVLVAALLPAGAALAAAMASGRALVY